MYRIIIDSCGEFTKEMEENPVFCHAPLSLQVGDWHQVDDETFDQKEFLKRVAECPSCPKSACPSPEEYIKLFDGYDEVYIVTLSGNLSGSYNSARTAVNMYYETNDTAKIHIFDSCSASIGETLVGLKIHELAEQGLGFEEIVVKTEEYKLSINTYFVLDNLETFRKNGRLTGVKAMMVSSLNIKPVMVGARGSIEQRGQAIGTNKALTKMADYLLSDVSNPQDRVLMITHCNCPDRAKYMRELMVKRASYKDIVVMDMAGVSTMYANDGGVIVTL